MFQSRLIIAISVSVLMTTLTACNIGSSPEPTADVNVLYTEAASTLIAQFSVEQTETAQAVTPTLAASPTSIGSPTPLPTFALAGGITPIGTLGLGVTPLATSAGPVQYSNPQGCNDAQYMGGDPDDGKKMSPQHGFKASWSLLNVGTCTWDEGYVFAYKSGDRLSGNDVKITKESQFTEPNHSQAFVVPMEAPKQPGEYQGFWQMRSDDGTWFGSLVWVLIVVE